MIMHKPAGNRRSDLAAWTIALLLPILLAHCGGGGGSSTESNFVDPDGQYSVSLEQTTDTCSNPAQLGPINWGGATMTLLGGMLRVDIPSEPGAMTCSQFTANYSMNSVRASGSQQVTDGTCTYNETLSVALMFTDMAFSGSYTTQRARVSAPGSCLQFSMLPCELAGTITGDGTVPGSPSCP